jgi:hypothetical protein
MVKDVREDVKDNDSMIPAEHVCYWPKAENLGGMGAEPQWLWRN